MAQQLHEMLGGGLHRPAPLFSTRPRLLGLPANGRLGSAVGHRIGQAIADFDGLQKVQSHSEPSVSRKICTMHLWYSSWCMDLKQPHLGQSLATASKVAICLRKNFVEPSPRMLTTSHLDAASPSVQLLFLVLSTRVPQNIAFLSCSAIILKIWVRTFMPKTHEPIKA